MNDQGQKIVDFTYCNTCKYKDVPDYDDPCDECLLNPVNTYSVKPTMYEKADQN